MTSTAISSFKSLSHMQIMRSTRVRNAFLLNNNFDSTASNSFIQSSVMKKVPFGDFPPRLRHC
jgi:hypothetical protein